MQNEIKIKFKEIQKILSEEWDPIPGSPIDEYDDYINRIISLHSKGEFNFEKLTQYLVSLEEGFSHPVDVDVTKKIAEKLLNILENGNYSVPVSANNLVIAFLKEFPELAEHPHIKGDDFKDTPYSFFGVINLILNSAIEEDGPLAERIANWLNNVLNDENLHNYIEEMLWIEFFEGSEVNEPYRNFLLMVLKDRANLMFRQYLYIMEHGGLTDPTTGEILKYMGGTKPDQRTGKYISDIK
jgi:hypothetical protein